MTSLKRRQDDTAHDDLLGEKEDDQRGERREGYEIKRTDATRITPSMRHALADLRLDRLTVVHAGSEAYPMGEKIRAMPLAKLVAMGKLA